MDFDLKNFDFAESMRRSQERLAKRDAELEDYYKETSMKFNITMHELKALKEWQVEHNKTCPFYDDGTKDVSPSGAIGGRTSYKFTPTGLGSIITVECACGAEKNVTDYECW
jgi:hypothetical protein